MNRVPRPMNTRRLLVICSLALVAVVSFALTLALVDGEGSSSGVKKPSNAQTPPMSSELPGGFEASEVYMFDSLGQMAATSDLIVTGTVAETTVGEVIDEASGSGGTYPDPWNSTEGSTGGVPPPVPEEPEDDTVEDYPTRFLDTEVRVDEVLKGSTPTADAITVNTLELAYGWPDELRRREPYAPPETWREPDKRVLLFLSKDAEKTSDLYYPVNHSQSVYVLEGNNLTATVSDPTMPLIERIASLSMPQLRLAVEEAKARIASGEVKPLKPPELDPIEETTPQTP